MALDWPRSTCPLVRPPSPAVRCTGARLLGQRAAFAWPPAAGMLGVRLPLMPPSCLARAERRPPRVLPSFQPQDCRALRRALRVPLREGGLLARGGAEAGGRGAGSSGGRTPGATRGAGGEAPGSPSAPDCKTECPGGMPIRRPPTFRGSLGFFFLGGRGLWARSGFPVWSIAPCPPAALTRLLAPVHSAWDRRCGQPSRRRRLPLPVPAMRRSKLVRALPRSPASAPHRRGAAAAPPAASGRATRFLGTECSS